MKTLLKIAFAMLCTIFFILGCQKSAILEPAQQLSLNEGFENPVGFYDREPSFSWKLPQGVEGQKAYSLAVASTPELLPDSADLWTTGKMISDNTLFVTYQGKPLRSRQKVYWMVRYWNQDDEPAPWSDVARMELGLLQNSDWHAKWVGLPTRNDSIMDKNNVIIHTPQYLRKDFNIPKEIDEARLYVSAKGVFTGLVNGESISDGVMSPGWTPYEKRIESLTYDVTDLVQQGDNTIGFQLASGWHFGRMLWNKMIWGQTGSPKVLCQLHLRFKDGTEQFVVSDDSWRGTTGGPIRFAEIYDGETYDANYEMLGWATPSYGIEAWQKVEAAELENSIKILPKRHNTVKNKLRLPAKKIIRSKDGSAVIFDLEQNMVGVPELQVPMKKGDTLVVRFSEMLEPDGSFYTENYRSAASTDHYIASKDTIISWRPTFTFHGFRYVELGGFDLSKEPQKSWVTGLVQYSDFRSNGSFQSSHEKLNQLQSNIVWGLRGNFFDIPTDCPQRDERLGWTGDAQVFAPTSVFNADVHSFWSSWLQTLRESQYDNGGIPFVAPDVLKNGKVSSGWGDAAVIIPWDIYMRTSDKSVLEDNYQMMKDWVSHHQSQTTDYISSMNTFGDWLQPNQAKESGKRGDTSRKLIGTAFFAHAANLTSKAAEVLGFEPDKIQYQKLYQTVAEAFEKQFFDDNGMVINGKATQTAYLLALNFKLLSKDKEEKAKNHLLYKIKEADNHLRTGFLGTPLLPKVLDDMGQTDLMYQILFKETYPSWFYSINQGATTIWERWNSYSKSEGYNPERMNSLNHYAYGAIGEWMYERIGGIKPLEPGYKKIGIAPLPGSGLTSAMATYDSPYGTISSSWSIMENIFNLEAVVPPNTTAIISIPSSKKESLVVNGKNLEALKDLVISEISDGAIQFEVPSGTYKIKANL